MIQANELRIGNWFLEFGIPTKADGRFIEKLEHIQLRNKTAIDVSPMPLTPEIFEKCGFSFGMQFQDFVKGKYHFVEIKKIIHGEFSENGIFYFWLNTKIKYLHQLQNLYFALTGEELNIEL